jgi:hypothetical protein
MKKPSKEEKQEFIAKVRKMKPAKGKGGGAGRSGSPKSKRVPNADGPGGSLGGY